MRLNRGRVSTTQARECVCDHLSGPLLSPKSGGMSHGPEALWTTVAKRPCLAQRCGDQGQWGHHLAKPEGVHSHHRVFGLERNQAAPEQMGWAHPCPLPYHVLLVLVNCCGASVPRFSPSLPTGMGLTTMQGPNAERVVSFPTTGGSCEPLASAARPLLAQAWGPPTPSLAAMAPRGHVWHLQASEGSCTVGLLIPRICAGIRPRILRKCLTS